ncbi:hypothetical protein [Streptomyces sp. 1114.5]|uniref:hypothetical protein n=1 Tax=Streptomyces sp. 1114.5 TaxID=1938830 RepID=UPI0011C39AB0|nr:hypothetical protein [Streptomyces sp. 1114.5]
MSTGGSSRDQWVEFVREFEKSNAAQQPGAAEPARPPERRRSRRRLLLLAMAALLVAGGAAAYLLRPSDPAPAAAPAPAPASAAPTSAAPSQPVAPSPSDDPSAAAGAPASAIPLSVFPSQVQGYTLVAAATNPTCTGPNTVAPTLAGLITQGHGCLGVDLVLYKDADGNQYNLALFTMKDQGDIAHLITVLGSHPEAYQAAVHIPPKDSGLRQLPPGSGLVQDYAASGHGMLLGMGQWSDGRTADLDKLSNQLSPLTEAVIRNVPA